MYLGCERCSLPRKGNVISCSNTLDTFSCNMLAAIDNTLLEKQFSTLCFGAPKLLLNFAIGQPCMTCYLIISFAPLNTAIFILKESKYSKSFCIINYIT